jgi:Mn-dependent DtxR family transcriptional regulator
MSRKETAEDVVTREAWLMYRLWKMKGFRGSISELSRELEYKDDSPVNRRINALKEKGYVEEERKASDVMFKLTNKGKRKILFMILPRYLLYSVLTLAFADIYWGLLGSYGMYIESWIILITGAFSLVLIILLIWMFRKGEEQLCQIGRPDLES